MVVGTGAYVQKNEAYPLDKKTLNSIVWRSFLMDASLNSETGESIGWLWAIMPGLKKIHEDEKDLALAMGHHLEYVHTGGLFSTFAMGVTLSLEQQKADLETIRSVRTAASAAADACGSLVFKYIFMPITLMWTIMMVQSGSVAGVAIYACVMLAAVCFLRFAMMNYGYAKGTRAVESLVRNKEALTHASRIGGLFILGVLAVYLTSSITPVMQVQDMVLTPESFFTGITGLLFTWLAYHLLAKKNKSIMQCVLLFMLFAVILGVLGVFGGSPFLG